MAWPASNEWFYIFKGLFIQQKRKKETKEEYRTEILRPTEPKCLPYGLSHTNFANSYP